jgi:uncharacterized protein
MPQQIFLSLAVASVAKSRAFYTALGWPLNATFSSETSASFAVSDAIQLMLSTPEALQTLSPKPLLSPATGTTVLISLACASRTEVDTLTEAAIKAGGRALHDPEDLGFMYSRAFEDLDGNGFGVFWMNPAGAAD